MTLRLYNTLTRQAEPFTPLNPTQVTVYVCGPTVYDVPHLGHARSAFVFDVLRRHLARTAQVRFVRNVTDVDDKIIERAKQESGAGGEGPGARGLKAVCEQVTQRYLASYHEAMAQLGIARPTVEPQATEHIDAMLDAVSKLLMEGVAYEAEDGVYFSVRAFPAYGRLSNRSLDDLRAGARVEPGEHKRDPLDFALWKKAKPGEPAWNSPWGPGRPGWHIECSTMSATLLGDAFDIHGGGLDLIFPHHENEIAQAQAAGKPFATVWVHNGLLTVNGEKMSKSLGNYITVEQALQDCRGDANILKVFFLGSHYRSPVDYTEKNVRAAAGRTNRFWDFLFAADSQRQASASLSDVPEVAKCREDFLAVMNDDLNTPRALATLDRLATLGHEWWKELEAGACGPSNVRTLRGKIVAAADELCVLAQSLGLDLRIFRQEELGADVKQLLEERETARKAGDFETADRKREAIFEKGFLVRDTFGGPIAIPLKR